MRSRAFDVFISYNSIDREVAGNIAEQLKRAGLRVWFDQWELRPGLTWQDELEVNIQRSRAVAVLIGPSGIGAWQAPEVRAALSKYMQEDNPVIPVVLPGVDKPELPSFLAMHTWVDCRAQQVSQESLDRLIWGITGQQPIHAISQIGADFPLVLGRRNGVEKTIRPYTFPNPRRDRLLDLSWDTFGKGIDNLVKQIRSPGTRLGIDACFGINDAGLVMAVFGAMTGSEDLRIERFDQLIAAELLTILDLQDIFIAGTMHYPGIEPPHELR